MAKLQLRKSVQSATKIKVYIKNKPYKLSAAQVMKLAEAGKLSPSQMTFLFENYKPPVSKKTNKKDENQDQGAVQK